MTPASVIGQMERYTPGVNQVGNGGPKDFPGDFLKLKFNGK